jgi:peptidoglycan/xylan/chitin deacetylase (PgdA/CDA1 family)/GNAT superfamily N-acetyltransferase
VTYAIVGSEAREDILRVLGEDRDARWLHDRAAAWSWQFERNPHADAQTTFLVALRDGAIVGVDGVMPARVRAGPRVVSGAWNVDMAVLRDARGAGHGGALMRRVPRLAELSMAYGISDLSEPLFAKQGWQRVRSLSGWNLPLRGDGPVWLARRARKAHLAALHGDSCRDPVDLRADVWPDDDALASLWDAVKSGYACAVERDAAYLRWKYRQHPAICYLPVSAWRGGKLLGLLIARPDPDLAVVDDWVGPAGAVGLLVPLLERCARALGQRGARAVYLETTDATLAHACRELGFNAVREGMRLRVWAPAHLANLPWLVMSGDGDNDLLHGCGTWNLHAPSLPVTSPPPREAPEPVLPPPVPAARPFTLGRVVRRVLASPRAVRALRATRRGRATVFMLHRFEPLGGRGPEHEPESLRRSLEALRRARVPLMHLDDMLRALRDGDPAADGAVALTVDDGYADVEDVAAPVLESFDAPYAVFLATGFLDHERWFWWDQIEYALDRAARRELTLDGRTLRWEATLASRDVALAALRPVLRAMNDDARTAAVRALCEQLEVALPPAPPAPYRPLAWDQVRAMSRRGLARFGPHTRSHPILARELDARSRSEITASVRRLREVLGAPLDVFCYPDGHADAQGDREAMAVRELGLLAALSAEHGWITRDDLRGEGRFTLRRVAWRDDPEYIVRAASGAQETLELGERLRRRA